MALLYADEQFPRRIVEFLRELGHDVLTVQEAGKAGLSDEKVLQFASADHRAVLTLNRRHFIRLHNQDSHHVEMIVCKRDDNWARQAANIHEMLNSVESLAGQLL